MSEQVVSAEVRVAALLGVVDILVQPEYGDSWVRECVSGAVPEDEVTDQLVEQVDALITAKLRALAVEVLAELPVEARAGYEFLNA